MSELVDFDELQRDAILTAIKERLTKLKHANRTEHVQKLVKLHKPDTDIVQTYVMANQVEINRLESVINYFSFMRI